MQNTYLQIFMYMYILYIYVYLCLHIHIIYTLTYTHAHTYTHTYAQAHLRPEAFSIHNVYRFWDAIYRYVHTYIFIHIYKYICIYLYVYIQYTQYIYILGCCTPKDAILVVWKGLCICQCIYLIHVRTHTGLLQA